MIEILDWDSEFFNLKVGKSESIFDPSTIDFDLVYCFADPMNDELNSFYRGIGANLVDKKRLYIKATPVADQLDQSHLRKLEFKDLNEDLYSLGLQSGEYSRFRTDSNFKTDSFSNLYRIWMERSLKLEIADEVNGYFINGQIAGFITLSCKNDKSNIGLIAVNKEFRGRGVGQKLLNASYHFSSVKNIQKIEVYTQGLNEIACRFYESNGFIKANEINIYHFWKKK